jgi:hypothetical protein
MQKCPHCNKEFKNLKQHITKSHLKLSIVFHENKMTVTTETGNVLTKDETCESEGENYKSYYFQYNDVDGFYVQLYNDKTVKVLTSKLLKSGDVREGNAFKNWSVKFTRKLRLKPT